MKDPLTHLRILLLLILVFSVVSSSAQLQRISNSDIPCDKVISTDGNLALGTNYWRQQFNDLLLFDINTSEILSIDSGLITNSIYHNGFWYFYLYSSRKPSNKVYAFGPAGLNEIAEFSIDHFHLQIEKSEDMVVGASPNGFYHFENGQVNFEVELGSPLLNLSSVSGQLIAVTSNAYFTLSPIDFSILDSTAIPEGWESFDGALLGSNLLITNTIEYGSEYRKIALFNLSLKSISPITNSENQADSIISFLRPIGQVSGKYLLSGYGQLRNNNTFRIYSETEAVLLDVDKSQFNYIGKRIGISNDRVNPELINAKNGPVLFGRMGYAGVEPYHFVSEKMEVLSDIYPGFGSGTYYSELYQPPFVPQDKFMSFQTTTLDSIIYFTAKSPGLGHQIWRTDGTKPGTYAITNMLQETKGFKTAFFSKQNEKILVTVTTQDEISLLFELEKNFSPFLDTFITNKNWEVSYSSNPLFLGGRKYESSNYPDAIPANDGSIACFLGQIEIGQDYISNNQNWIYPANWTCCYKARSVIQILESDGSLRSSVFIENHSYEESIMGRRKNDGHIFVLVSHGGKELYLDNREIKNPAKGHFLIELDEFGNFIRSNFLSTGGKDNIGFKSIKVSEEGIYLMGLAKRNFSMEGVETMDIEERSVRVVTFKYNFSGKPIWISAFKEDLNVFGLGHNIMEIDDQNVYLSTGATSYNVTSTCANSTWDGKLNCINRENGIINWERDISSDDVFRITSIQSVNDNFVWYGGYTRGNLTLEKETLLLNPIDQKCTNDGFLLCLNKSTGQTLFLEAYNGVKRVKYPQNMTAQNEVLHVLSLVHEEELVFRPYFNNYGRTFLQLDRFTSRGMLLDSASWPITNISTSSRDLRYNKFSIEIHPDGGIIIAGQNMVSGEIAPFTVGLENSKGLNSWLVQRRLALPSIESNKLELSDGQSPIIFPNPSNKNSVEIKLNEADFNKYDSIIIYDSQGRICDTQSLEIFFDSFVIELDQKLINGLYLVRLHGPLDSKTTKLIIQR